MTQMTQGSVDDSTSDISNDGSYNKPDKTTLVTPGPTKKQITLTQYARSINKRKKDEEERMKERLEEDDDDNITFIKTKDEVKNLCIHCHSRPCHDSIFGEFCSEDTNNY